MPPKPAAAVFPRRPSTSGSAGGKSFSEWMDQRGETKLSVHRKGSGPSGEAPHAGAAAAARAAASSPTAPIPDAPFSLSGGGRRRTVAAEQTALPAPLVLPTPPPRHSTSSGRPAPLSEAVDWAPFATPRTGPLTATAAPPAAYRRLPSSFVSVGGADNRSPRSAGSTFRSPAPGAGAQPAAPAQGGPLCHACGFHTTEHKYCPETGRRHPGVSALDGAPRSPRSPLDSARWRSDAIFHEVQLKELLADDYRLPNAQRLQRLWEHYDSIAEKMPEMKGVFGLLRSELVTSIYASGVTATGAVDRVPYFEALSQLQRESDELRGELSELRREAQHDTLRYDVDALRSQCSYLQHQTERLKHENETMLEDVTKLTQANEQIQNSGREAFSNLEKQYRAVQEELRQCMISNAQMAHDARSRQTTLAEYTHAKHEQMQQLRAMFSASAERQTIMHLQLQLEACENRLLDQYDAEMHRAPQEEWAGLRLRFVNQMRLVLEEQHQLELLQVEVGLRGGEDWDDEDGSTESRSQESGSPRTTSAPPPAATRSPLERVVTAPAEAAPGTGADASAAGESAPAETAGPAAASGSRGQRVSRAEAAASAAAALQPRMHEALPTDATPMMRRASVLSTGDGKGRAGPEAPRSARSKGAISELLAEVALSQVAGPTCLDGLGDQESDERSRFIVELLQGLPGATEAGVAAALGDLPCRLRAADSHGALPPGGDVVVPMLDCDPAKFHGERFELLTATGRDQAPELWRNVSTADPGGMAEIPVKATHLLLRYNQPRQARPRPARDDLSFAQRDELEQEQTRAVRLRAELGNALPRALLEKVAEPPRKASTKADDRPQEDPSRAAWVQMMRRHRGWRPQLPRALPAVYVELTLCLAYSQHSSLMLQRYLSFCEQATRGGGPSDAIMAATSPEEKMFSESILGGELAIALSSVLEKRYQLPEVVIKVTYETLLGCAAHAQQLPHLLDFTRALGGEADIAQGKVLSLSYALLTERWPLSAHQLDERVAQKDLTAVLEDLYPAAGGQLDDIVSDVAIFTQTDFTLRRVREYFAAAVENHREFYVRRALEQLQFKTSTLHWSELDRVDFVDACSHLLQQQSVGLFGRLRTAERLVARHIEACQRIGPKGRVRLPPSHLCLLVAEAEWEQVAVRLQSPWLAH